MWRPISLVLSPSLSSNGLIKSFYYRLARIHREEKDSSLWVTNFLSIEYTKEQRCVTLRHLLEQGLKLINAWY